MHTRALSKVSLVVASSTSFATFSLPATSSFTLAAQQLADFTPHDALSLAAFQAWQQNLADDARVPLLQRGAETVERLLQVMRAAEQQREVRRPVEQPAQRLKAGNAEVLRFVDDQQHAAAAKLVAPVGAACDSLSPAARLPQAMATPFIISRGFDAFAA